MTNVDLTRNRCAMLSHKGMERETNDDKVFSSKDLGLWVLSDGVGGLVQGEQASQYTVDEIHKSVKNGFNLRNSVHSAHSVIKAYNKHEEEDRGATVVAVLENDERYKVAWVGDSRAYLWSRTEGSLTQLTEDHTLVQKLINAGLLDESEAKTHPQRHVITECLGIENDHPLHIGELSRRWEFGEELLLASDGLYEELTADEIAKVLALPRDSQAKVELLVEMACEKGGNDNVSLMIISSPVLVQRAKKRVSFLDMLKSVFSKKD